jgi:hypothetical protein
LIFGKGRWSLSSLFTSCSSISRNTEVNKYLFINSSTYVEVYRRPQKDHFLQLLYSLLNIARFTTKKEKANVCFASRNLLFVVSFSMWRASQKYLSDEAPNRVRKDQTLKSAMFTNEKKISSNFCRKQFWCIYIKQFLSIKSEETEVIPYIS